MRKNFINYSVTYAYCKHTHKEEVFDTLEAAQAFYQNIKNKNKTVQLRANYMGKTAPYWRVLEEYYEGK